MDPTKNMAPLAAEAFRLGTEIYELAFQSDIPALTALLQNADKKVLDHHDNVDGTTILMVAARDGNTTVVHSLLALGPEKVDRHVRDRTGWTALHWAACGATDNNGSGLRPNPTGEVVRLLLNSGLRDDVRGADDETPVDVALKMLNAPALMAFSEWGAAHGGRGVGVRIGAVGNGYAGARYTDRRSSTSYPATTASAGVASAPASSSLSTPATTSARAVPAPASSSLFTPAAAAAAASARHVSASASSSLSTTATTRAKVSGNKSAARRPAAREAAAGAPNSPPSVSNNAPPTPKATKKAEEEPQFPW